MESVDALIDRVMADHPGTTSKQLATYFDAVHQELAPLARSLESEVGRLNAAAAQHDKTAVDLATLVRRLAAALHKLDKSNTLPGKATDYLKRVGLSRVSALRIGESDGQADLPSAPL